MAVEGGMKCVKFLVFTFNFIFWVSAGPGGTGEGAPGPAEPGGGALPRRGQARPSPMAPPPRGAPPLTSASPRPF